MSDGDIETLFEQFLAGAERAFVTGPLNIAQHNAFHASTVVGARHGNGEPKNEGSDDGYDQGSTFAFDAVLPDTDHQSQNECQQTASGVGENDSQRHQDQGHTPYQLLEAFGIKHEDQGDGEADGNVNGQVIRIFENAFLHTLEATVVGHVARQQRKEDDQRNRAYLNPQKLAKFSHGYDCHADEHGRNHRL